MSLTTIADATALLASTALGLVAFAAEDLTGGLLPFINAGAGILAFIALWYLHRDSLARHQSETQRLFDETVRDRREMIQQFREELQNKRSDYTKAMSTEGDANRAFMREMATQVRDLTQAIEKHLHHIDKGNP